MTLPSALCRVPRTLVAAAAVLVLVTAGVAVWTALRGAPAPPSVVARNISRDPRVCLITDDARSTATASAWSGIEAAARRTPMNAQRLVVPAHAGRTRQTPYVNALLQRHCVTIVSVGAGLDSVVAAAARQHPAQRFVSTGSVARLPNVQQVPATAAAVEKVVYDATRKK